MKKIIHVILVLAVYTLIMLFTILPKIASMAWFGELDDTYWEKIKDFTDNIIPLPY